MTRPSVNPGAPLARVAFVPPRFGPGVVGGSEAVSAEAATGLARRGWDVEVLTTCAVDHFHWSNVVPPGTSRHDGVAVRRFPVVHRPTRAGGRAEAVIQQGGHPTLDEQVSWLGVRFSVPALFHHLVEHGAQYDAVVFSPYLFWTTVAGMQAVPERAVVMPCLHDEPYARLEVLRPVLADAASLWFLSEPEHALAHRLGPVSRRHTVTGAGMHAPASYAPDRFRARYGITRPFALYAGRREGGKGWKWLLEAFSYAVVEGGVDLDLVTIGVGAVDIPAPLRARVIDLGFVGPEDRDDAFAAASVYVQPSRMESFSRTVMEAWLAETPVVATADGEVVAWHCRRSGGGMLFSGREELAEQLRLVAECPEHAKEIARKGRHYVETYYSWDAVLDRMEDDLRALS